MIQIVIWSHYIYTHSKEIIKSVNMVFGFVCIFLCMCIYVCVNIGVDGVMKTVASLLAAELHKYYMVYEFENHESGNISSWLIGWVEHID